MFWLFYMKLELVLSYSLSGIYNQYLVQANFYSSLFYTIGKKLRNKIILPRQIHGRPLHLVGVGLQTQAQETACLYKE